MNKLSLTLTPRRAALVDGADTEFEVLAALTAPDAPTEVTSRTPLNLSLVIDRSGSMQGRPLEEAKRCAEYIIQHLDARDRLSIVAFDNTAEVYTRPLSGDQKQELTRAVRSIHVGGMTALHDGWVAGAAQIAAYATHSAIARVLLLTDGIANVGETAPAAIASDCARLAAAGVSTSTYGLGQHFNEVLLAAMADAGSGHAYYGETAEDLMDPFREEFDLLRTLCGRKLRLKFEAVDGVTVEVLNDYRVDASGRTMLPDLAYGAAAWALLKVCVPAALAASVADGLVPVLTAVVEFEDMQQQECSSNLAQLRLRRLPRAVFAALAEDETVVARSREVFTSVIIARARTAAMNGDWATVDLLMNDARTLGGDNEWVQSVVTELQKLARRRDRNFSKVTFYHGRKVSQRLAGRDESGPYDLGVEAAKPGFLQRKSQEGKKLGDGEGA